MVDGGRWTVDGGRWVGTFSERAGPVSRPPVFFLPCLHFLHVSISFISFISSVPLVTDAI